MAILRVLTVILPVLFLVAADLLRHTVLLQQLHTLPGFLATYGAVAVATAAFSWGVFRAITKLQRQLVEQNERLATLNRVAAVLAENMDLQQLLEVALDSVLATMRVEMGLICLLDQEHEELASVCQRGLSAAMIQRVRRQKLADAPAGAQAVRTGRPVIRERIFEDPHVSELAKQEGIRSSVSVPLQVQGEVTGVLAIVSRHERHFLPAEIEILTNLGHQLGLAIRNSVLYEETQRTNAELTTLLAVGKAATSSLHLHEMLSRALDTLVEVTAVEAAEVWITEGSEVVLQMHRGACAGAFLERSRFAVGEGFPGIVAATRTPLITHTLSQDPRFLRQEVKDAGFQTFGVWPLLHGEKLFGVLAVAARAPEALHRARELRLMEGLTEHLAIAIENALLHQQVQDAAIVEERERIAREMHDSLGQVLGYINTQILALRQLLRRDAKASALEHLGEMQEAVQQLYADVREGILGLRSSAGKADGLVRALEGYLERYRSMVEFQVVLEVSPEATAVRLPPASEVQLVRIIQEALSNVRKHAGATRATVRLVVANGLHVSVADDGSGFDLSARFSTGWPRFGLQTMRERAEAVGGHFAVESAPGQGTRVIVTLPVASE
ncbi:MAG: GAF domain-containing protein [Chloroflexi bacterium]|nr:GAF domain-containing protein [Chloroflexota bacterium]